MRKLTRAAAVALIVTEIHEVESARHLCRTDRQRAGNDAQPTGDCTTERNDERAEIRHRRAHDRRRVPREPERRPRGLDRRRAGRRRHRRTPRSATRRGRSRGLYDALHDPATRDLLRRRTATASARTGSSRRPTRPRTCSRARGDRALVAHVVRLHGPHARLQGRRSWRRSAPIPEWYAPFAGSAAHWYREYAAKALFLNHVLDQPADRPRQARARGRGRLRARRPRARRRASSSAARRCSRRARRSRTRRSSRRTARCTLEKGKAEDYALVFIAPMDTPGKKLLCRASYEAERASPFDHPLSSRFDENDAVLVFDDAFIPWENVLVYRDVEKATGFYAPSGFFNRYTLQSRHAAGGEARLHDRALSRGLRANGTDGFRGVQAELGELVGWRSLIWAMTTALCHDTAPGPGRQRRPASRLRRDARAAVRQHAVPAVKEISARSWAARRSSSRRAPRT